MSSNNEQLLTSVVQALTAISEAMTSISAALTSKAAINLGGGVGAGAPLGAPSGKSSGVSAAISAGTGVKGGVGGALGAMALSVGATLAAPHQENFKKYVSQQSYLADTVGYMKEEVFKTPAAEQTMQDAMRKLQAEGPESLTEGWLTERFEARSKKQAVTEKAKRQVRAVTDPVRKHIQAFGQAHIDAYEGIVSGGDTWGNLERQQINENASKRLRNVRQQAFNVSED